MQNIILNDVCFHGNNMKKLIKVSQNTKDTNKNCTHFNPCRCLVERN